jgi:N-methylhydantoinase A
VTARSGGAEVELAQGGSEDDVSEGSRTAILGGEEVELAVVRGSPPPGYEVEGPAVVELPESTLLVPPGWSGEVDGSGTVQLRRG